MKKTEEDFAAFERAVNDEAVLNRTRSFAELCDLIGAERKKLEKLIFNELGYYGQEVMDICSRWGKTI